MSAKQYVGLLIAPDSIQAVQCSQNEAGEIGFDFYHHLAVTESCVDEDGDVLNPEALGHLLGQFWAECGIKNRNVVLGLSGKRAIARLATLPRIPATKLHQVVLSEAEQYTLFRDEEPLVDYFTVDTDDENSTVFYTAASQKLINAYKKALGIAKLHLKAIDIGQYAALRALVHFKLSDSDVWDGVIVLPSRLVITSWFGQKLLNWREVSAQRWEEDGVEQRFQFIETEISRTLRAENGREREILVAKGSLAESAQMSDYFQRFTDIRLQAAGIDYWCRRLPPEALKNVTPTALGLALWSLEKRIPTLDLLHRSGKSELGAALQAQLAGLKLDRGAGIAAGFAAASLVLGSGSMWYVGDHVIGNKITQLKRDINGLTSDQIELQGKFATLSKQKDANDQILTLIGSQARTNLAVSFMEQVNDIVPADAWLYSLTAPSPESLILKGGANSQSSGLTLARKIAEFTEVGQVKIDDLTQPEPGRFEYTIEVAIDPSKMSPGGGAGQ